MQKVNYVSPLYTKQVILRFTLQPCTEKENIETFSYVAKIELTRQLDYRLFAATILICRRWHLESIFCSTCRSYVHYGRFLKNVVAVQRTVRINYLFKKYELLNNY